MEQITKIIIRDDLYYIIIPIIIAAIDVIIQMVNAKSGKEKQWKVMKRKSSSERYNKYFVFILVLGLLILVFYMVFMYAIEIALKTSISILVVKIIYPIYTTLVYLYIGKEFAEIDISFKKKYKHEKKIALVMDKVPLCFSWFIWTFVLYEQVNVLRIVRVVVLIIIIMYELFYLSILDNKNTYQYDYVTFHFYNNKEIDNIEVQNVFQKGNWIVARKMDVGKEFRFRIKDVEHVEYREEI